MAVHGKNIVLGVTGSIAAYKAADLIGRLRKAGADVHVVMTDAAARFVTPTTLATLSRNPVGRDQFDDSRWEPEHTALADDADLFVVAPATANTIAKMAHGIADDLLTTLIGSCPVPDPGRTCDERAYVRERHRAGELTEASGPRDRHC